MAQEKRRASEETGRTLEFLQRHKSFEIMQKMIGQKYQKYAVILAYSRLTSQPAAVFPRKLFERSGPGCIKEEVPRTVVDFPRLDEIWLFEHSKLGNSFMMKKPAKFS